jgi:type IV pilus assembly protein PilC
MARVKYNLLLIFTNQLAAMISANLPLGRILESLSRESMNKRLLSVVRSLKTDVESGVDFGRAVAKHPQVFDAIYVNMIKAGMATGRLDQTLEQLRVYMEKSAETKSKVRSALAYPIFMVGFLILTVLLMVFKILPMFKKMFAGFGDQLPLPTRIMIQMSEVITNYFHVGLILIGLMVAVAVYFLKTPWGRTTWDKYKLRIPLFGDLMKKAALAKFLRTFATLTQSEVPILDSLSLVSTSGNNKYLEARINLASEMIERGMSIATAFRRSGFFPESIIQMIASGEETGNLDRLLISAANFYDDQVDEAIKSMVALINPILTVVIGGTIGLMMIAIFLPIFEMGGAVRG